MRSHSTSLPRTDTTQSNFVQLLCTAYQQRNPFSHPNEARVHATHDCTEATRVNLTNFITTSILVENVTYTNIFHTEWTILATPLKENERRYYIILVMHSNRGSRESNLNQYVGTARSPIGIYTETQHSTVCNSAVTTHVSLLRFLATETPPIHSLPARHAPVHLRPASAFLLS